MTLPQQTEPIVMWRCRRCGKFSHAKRRPGQHQAPKVIEERKNEYRKSVMVWCGPFDRYVAHHDDPKPPDESAWVPGWFGHPVVGTEIEWEADPNDGIGVPF